MPTYNGWPVVALPSDPSAPASIDFIADDAVAMSMSPFTGQQQIQRWGRLPMQINMTLPPLAHTRALAWVAFLQALNGREGVFQLSATFIAAYSESLSGSQYWRLRSNRRTWSVANTRLFGITLELIEAL